MIFIMCAKNTAVDLGEMVRIEDLRIVWKDEAKNFTPWLAEIENLKILGKAIGIELEDPETESSVGSFNVDIVAKEAGSNRTVVIENQLGRTDHDHLGKIITYASGKDADVVIWIVGEVRDEHRQAVEWLNQRTNDSVGFFLVEMELWKIDSSRIAPRFSVVESPNTWARIMKKQEGLSGTKLLQYEYWSSFRESAADDKKFESFRLQGALPRNYYDLHMNHSTCIIELKAKAKENVIQASFYIVGDLDTFNALQEKRDIIEQKMGCKLEWHAAQANSYIYLQTKGDMSNRADWARQFAWLRQQALKLRAVIRPMV